MSDNQNHLSTSPIYETCQGCVARDPNDTRDKEKQPQSVETSLRLITYRCVDCGTTTTHYISETPEAKFQAKTFDLPPLWG